MRWRSICSVMNISLNLILCKWSGRADIGRPTIHSHEWISFSLSTHNSDLRYSSSSGLATTLSPPRVRYEAGKRGMDGASSLEGLVLLLLFLVAVTAWPWVLSFAMDSSNRREKGGCKVLPFCRRR